MTLTKIRGWMEVCSAFDDELVTLGSLLTSEMIQIHFVVSVCWWTEVFEFFIIKIFAVCLF